MKPNLLNNLIAAAIIVFTIGVGGVLAQDIEFKVNPNKLPYCPLPDTTKLIDNGKDGRTRNWHNCWAGYVIDIDIKKKGAILEGEWRDGFLNGKGSFSQFNGEKYIGDFVSGMREGDGVLIYADGSKYKGEFKNDVTNGKGIFVNKNGSQIEGFWDNGFIKNAELKNSYPSTLQKCPKADYTKNSDFDRTAKWDNCYGEYEYSYGVRYEGEFKGGLQHGNGTYIYYNGDKYVGEFFEHNKHGKGALIYKDGRRVDGIWESNNFKPSQKINVANSIKTDNSDYKNLELEKQLLAEERRKFEEEKRTREQARNNQRINLQVTNTQANSEGDFVINIQTGTDTASLKINGEEQGGKQDGSYSIRRVARAGQTTQFTILAKDVYGNSDSKTISVTRQVTASSQVKYAELNPTLVKTQSNKDAVAIIIGIADYKNLPRADYANDDARVFYDYAIRGLGVRVENIKLLVDADAGQGEIYKAFKTWLPSRVKSTTDVYVYYSGHGLPAADGQSLYLLPQLADRDLIEETAIAQNKINAAIQAAKPKSVTIFLDSCYSGAGRTGATLLASARPIAIKSTAQAFPAEFTVISASTAEQISSSSNELKHGIFSYYLMRGMEGEADANKDGKITAGEMHSYLTDNVTKQASLANRVQQPQLAGDANRVLVGR